MKFIKGNVTGSIVEFCKIILVSVLAMFVVLKSDAALSQATNITKEVSVDALASVNDSLSMAGGMEDFAAQAAGVLWVDLVHEPWKTAEFMHTDVSDDVVDKFLSEKDAKGRAELVEGFGEDSCFKMNISFERVGFLMIYLIPCLAKCLLYIAAAGALMIFQVLAVFYLILAPVMLLLFLIAGYESVLTAWLKKMLETQIMILVITLMLALLIRTDIFLFEQAREWGWFLILLVQLLIGAGLFLNRGRIFELLGNVQRGVATPRYAANRLRMGGNIVNARRDAALAGKQIRQHIRTSAGKIGAVKEKMTKTQLLPVQAAADGAAPVAEKGILYHAVRSENPGSGTEGGHRPADIRSRAVPSNGRMLLQAGRMVRKAMQNEKAGPETGKPGAAVGRTQDVPANVKETLRITQAPAQAAPPRFHYSDRAQKARKGPSEAVSLKMKESMGETSKGPEKGQERVKKGTSDTAGRKTQKTFPKEKRRRLQTPDNGRGKKTVNRGKVTVGRGK